MTKMLDTARPSGPCSGSCPRVVARPVTDAPVESTLNRTDASLIKMYEAGLLKTLGLYRMLVDLEIGRASEWGARWWSRRLVEVYEESVLARFDQ